MSLEEGIKVAIDYALFDKETDSGFGFRRTATAIMATFTVKKPSRILETFWVWTIFKGKSTLVRCP